MHRVIYHGWVGHNNLGDEALFSASKIYFRKFKFTRWNSRLRKFVLPKACLLGGGTLINHGQKIIERFRREQNKMPLFIFGAGVRNPLFWQQVEPGQIGARDEWNKILSKCPFVGVRGPHSMNTLISQGFDKAKIIGDPVLAFADKDIHHKKDARRIGINLGFAGARLWGMDEKKVYGFFVNLIKGLKKMGFHISLFSVWPEDTKIVKEIGRESGIQEIHVYYKYCPEILAYLRGIDLFVGMKLHSVILAHCAYTPSIMIEYRPKCADYMASLSLDELNFRCDKIAVPSLIGKINELYGESKPHQEFLFRKISSYRQIQTKFAFEIMKYVENL